MANENAHIKEPHQADNLGATAGEIVTQGHALQQVRTEYFTAVRVEMPRNMKLVTEKVLAEASLAGELCLYSWDVRDKGAKKHIEGLSIQSAMILARNYGNCVVDISHVIDRVDAWEIKAVFIDLEAGTSISRPFRKAKQTPNTAKMRAKDPDRAADIEFQTGISKAERNVTLHAMPIWLRDDMITAAKDGALNRVDAAIEKDGIQKVREMIADALKKFGVSIEKMEDTVDLKMADWSKHDIFMLRTNLQTLKDGMASVDTVFPGKPVDDEAKPGKEPKGKPDLQSTVAAKANGEEQKPPEDASSPEDKAAPEEKPEPTAEPEQPKATESEPQQPPPQAEAEGPANRLKELMAMKKDHLQVEALEAMQRAMDAGVIENQFDDDGDNTPFKQEMVKEGILKDGDVTSSANNKGHLARLIARLEGLIADKKETSKQEQLPY